MRHLITILFFAFLTLVQPMRKTECEAKPAGRFKKYPLELAASKGLVETARELLKQGCSPNIKGNGIFSSGFSPLHYASFYGFKEVAVELLKASANVDALDNNGRTPLMYAAANGNKEVAVLLLDYGADTSIVDASQYSSKMLAQAKAMWDVVKLIDGRKE